MNAKAGLLMLSGIFALGVIGSTKVRCLKQRGPIAFWDRLREITC